MDPARLPKPTDSELDILRIIWENGPSSVRLVNERLNLEKKTGYTTTLKLMQIMTEKGLLSREEKGRMHIYNAVLEEAETQKQLLERFVDSAFGGSAMQLVMQALGKHKASPEELRKLRELIDKIEKQQE